MYFDQKTQKERQMTSVNTLCKQLLNVNDLIVEDVSFTESPGQDKAIRIRVHPRKGRQWECPECGRRCRRYDIQMEERSWRGLDFGGILVYIYASVPRVHCPKHGVRTADVPWAFPKSGFTKEFCYTVTWMAKYLSRSAVSRYMRIDWETVGRCIKKVHEDLEPDVGLRLDGLVKIGIDETSYRKGHKYITVVVNHETNTVVWAAKDHGKSVLSSFFESLTEDQRASIEVVTGDGAKWITDCVHEYLPNAERCVDPFHVVEWAMDAMDKVRTEAWHEAARTAAACKVKRGRGRIAKDDLEAQEAARKKKEATAIKDSKYALGKAPEHLTNAQEIKLAMIQQSNKKLYRAYLLKERLRLIFKMDNPEDAEEELMAWIQWARRCRIPSFVELQRKIMRHKDHILNTIRLDVSNARIEATNNKIKLLIRQAYGFRNIDNMIAMILLYCSDVKIPLPNRHDRNGPQHQAA